MKVGVWILSRYDGKGLFAVAYPTCEALVEDVRAEYDVASYPVERVQYWLDEIGSGFGYEFAIDHDYMEVEQRS